MLEVLTLFAGLVTGVQAVELEVSAPVAEVELSLDGEVVERLAEPPWTAGVDLGEALRPRRLVAVGRDRSGREIRRVERWINVARGAYGSYPPAVARSGGDATPVVLVFEDPAEPPAPGAMAGWFAARDEPVDVLAVERGPATVLIVRDPSIQPTLDRFVSRWLEDVRSLLRFEDGTEVRFLSPRAAPVSSVASPKEIFNVSSSPMSRGEGLLLKTVANRPPSTGMRLSDAVAVAGLDAQAGARRRAVVVLFAAEPAGRSRYRPEQVRAYLEDLQVPFFGASFDGGLRFGKRRGQAQDADALGAWGDVRAVIDRPGMNVRDFISRWQDAFRDLRRELDRQRVVWLRGRHLPQEVRLVDPPGGVRLAGAPPEASRGDR